MEPITNDGDKDADQLRVEVFMAKMRNDMQTIPTAPTTPSLEIRKLRARLMLEECLETISAGLGLTVNIGQDFSGTVVMPDLQGLEFSPHHDGPNLIQLIDGLCDCYVVNDGTASAAGIAMRPCKRIVMSNNLTKFGPGHKFNEHGKLIKPPNFIGPFNALAAELKRQGANPKQIDDELEFCE